MCRGKISNLVTETFDIFYSLPLSITQLNPIIIVTRHQLMKTLLNFKMLECHQLHRFVVDTMASMKMST